MTPHGPPIIGQLPRYRAKQRVRRLRHGMLGLILEPRDGRDHHRSRYPAAHPLIAEAVCLRRFTRT